MRPDEITALVDTRWFNSLAGLGSWFVNILGAVLILGIFYWLLVVIEHKIKVTIFPVYGADPEKLTEIEKLGDLRDYNVELGHPRIKRGKDVKHHGVRKFSILMNTFFPKPTIVKDVSMEYRYPDGVWFLQPNKDNFIPILRPDLSDTVNIKVTETDMDLWQQAAEADVRRRTQDEDALKKQMYFTIAIIIGAFALAGLIIWLSMSFAGKSIENVLMEVKPMTEALQNMAGSKGPG